MPTYIPTIDYSKINILDYIPNMKEKFPYSAVFAGTNLKIISPHQEDIHLAMASADKLKPFIDPSIDLDVNKDLVGVAFNAFVVNRANKNDQIISTEDALACIENFKYKALNIEHNRERVVGLVTGYGFSEFGSDEPLSLDQVKAMTDPFNVFLTGFVWRVVNPEFVEALEDASDPTSDSYMQISTSWEMGFREFQAVSGGKNLNECKAAEFENEEELKGALRHFGGTGVDKNGMKVYLQLVGEILPLGVGFTNNPAADVKGVVVKTKSEEPEKQEQMANSSEESEKKPILNAESEKNISQTEKNNVIEFTEQQKTLAMLIKKIADITDESMKEVKASDVTSFIESEIKKASEEWVAKKAEDEQALETLRAEAESFKAEFEKAKAELEKVQADLDAMKEEVVAREMAEAFQSRMSALDEEYDLSDDDRQVIGSQIKEMDEESFSAWQSSFKVIAKEKAKSYKKEMEDKMKEKAGEMKEDKKEEVKASTEEGDEAAKKALDEAKASDGDLPNAQSQSEPDTLFAKWKKAFNKETVKVTIKE
jgi:hypothetical protein